MGTATLVAVLMFLVIALCALLVLVLRALEDTKVEAVVLDLEVRHLRVELEQAQAGT